MTAATAAPATLPLPPLSGDAADAALMKAVVENVRRVRLGGGMPTLSTLRSALEVQWRVDLEPRAESLRLWFAAAMTAMDRRDAARSAAAAGRKESGSDGRVNAPRSKFEAQLVALMERLTPDPDIASALWVSVSIIFVYYFVLSYD